MTIYSQKETIQIPKIDSEGNVYAWETDIVDTGKFTARVENITPEEKTALEIAITPGSKNAIMGSLETLAQLKPIGRSDLKQAVVISHLVFDLLDFGVSEYVAKQICKEYRRDPSSDFFPNPAKFLEKAKNLMGKYRAAFAAIDSPPPPEKTITRARHAPKPADDPLDPWIGKNYQDAIADGSIDQLQAAFEKSDKTKRSSIFLWVSRYAVNFLDYPQSLVQSMAEKMVAENEHTA